MRDEPIDVEHYATRLDALERLAAAAPTVASYEVAAVIEDLCVDLSPWLAAADLERDIAEMADVDIDSLLEAANQLGALSLPDWPVTSERTLSPKAEFARLYETLAGIRKDLATLHRLELAGRIQFGVEGSFLLLLTHAARARIELPNLVAAAAEKLQAISEPEIMQLWARVQEEFAPTRILTTLPREAPELPAHFLDIADVATIRTRLAEYAVHVKARILARRFEASLGTYPTEAAGLGRILAVNTKPSILEYDHRQQAMIRTIYRLAAAWSGALGQPAQRLAEFLGLPEQSRLVRGSDVQDAKKSYGSAPATSSAAIAIHAARALLAQVQRRAEGGSSLTAALSVHKLGLEVTIPASTAWVKARNELELQKDLSRFLLERGHYTEGTKFGRFETDLLSRVRALTIVVEVKLFGVKRAPTEAAVRAALSQLHDYMDKQPARARGILLIYNLSPTVLTAPRRWLKGRFWITPVNLGVSTGSKRRRTMIIQEGREREVVEFEIVDADA